jgi:hypothetical protein
MSRHSDGELLYTSFLLLPDLYVSFYRQDGTDDSAGQCSFSSQIPGDGRYVPQSREAVLEDGDWLTDSDQGHIKSQSNEH